MEWEGVVTCMFSLKEAGGKHITPVRYFYIYIYIVHE